MPLPTYSFIIPVKHINDYIRQSVPEILKIKRSDYEIIIYPDVIDAHFRAPKTRQIATGSLGPAAKRTLAQRDARGKILIFIDDDAYPQADFLDVLDRAFARPHTIAIGGPALTPPTDSFLQKVSGAVFLSALSGGHPERYTPLPPRRSVDDWPSVNLSVKKSAFAAVNGFNSNYWPGEDTLFCLELIKKTNRPIIYEPQAIVYHHRRPGLIRHLKQISQYGRHRGFFAKKYPPTSLRPHYFLPSLFLLYNFALIFLLLLYLFFPHSHFLDYFQLLSCGYLLYALALSKAFLDIYHRQKNLLVALVALYYIFFTHLVYGWYFIAGFVFTRHLRSHLREQKRKN
jgi:glycosyltransferase involved in cell wall biosynthesis